MEYLSVLKFKLKKHNIKKAARNAIELTQYNLPYKYFTICLVRLICNESYRFHLIKELNLFIA